MRLVIALGGNALLRRGEAMSAEAQQRNVARAAEALAPVVREHEVIITHGNGPQVGLLALQAAGQPAGGAFPLDVLDAESEGMIGYLIEQELMNRLAPEHPVATLLTQIRVDPRDRAFAQPTKPIGPLYGEAEAARIAAERGWSMGRDGEAFRRVVPSPAPMEILEARVIELLIEAGVTVICAGGGGIPVVKLASGAYAGVEAVIDKDRASELTARVLGADGLIMLTDVAAVARDFGTRAARGIRRAHPDAIAGLGFEAGSMGPKVEAACGFVRTQGGFAAIGALEEVQAILEGSAGTRIANSVEGIELAK